MDSLMNIQTQLSHIISYAALLTLGVGEAGVVASEAVGGVCGAEICPV